MKQEQAVVAFFEERKLSAELFDDMREHQRESQKGHAVGITCGLGAQLCKFAFFASCMCLVSSNASAQPVLDARKRGSCRCHYQNAVPLGDVLSTMI